jgi:hypothetical protein
MSIVTNLLDGLHFVEAVGSKAIAFESRLTWISRLASRREWSSTSEQRGFDAAQLSRRAYLDHQGRIPIAR